MDIYGVRREPQDYTTLFLFQTFRKSLIKNASRKKKTCAKRKTNRMFLVTVFTEGKYKRGDDRDGEVYE